jgi:DNA polymerase-4
MSGSAPVCRDCGTVAPNDATRRCDACGSPRLLRHPELHTLTIAHVDCDAFYAAVEKRDAPELRDRPVIVGGGKRGVVSACCYISRMYGVRSAMPMFKARKLCPEAVVIPPNMKKYAGVGREVRRLMLETTPLVEPLSIDEAFLDLSGTEKLHGGSPAQTLVRFARRADRALGITVSVGLSYNKFLAKLASDLDKPRGFSVIGRGDALVFLAPRPVGTIWGVGPSLQKSLARDGLLTVGQLRDLPEADLVRRYGSIGRRLSRFSHGLDDRAVEPDSPTKSISAETTFERDLGSEAALSRALWPLCETVSGRLKAAELAGRGVTLKLKSADFKIRTRSRMTDAPTQLADVIFRAASNLLKGEADGTAYRLIGVGVTALESAANADPPDLLDPDAARRAQVERAVDQVRKKLGKTSIAKGRGL